MKITAKSKRILGMMVLLALPLVLFAVIREQNSWRPQTFVALKKHPIKWIDFSPDGKKVSTVAMSVASGSGPPRSRVFMWDFANAISQELLFDTEMATERGADALFQSG